MPLAMAQKCIPDFRTSGDFFRPIARFRVGATNVCSEPKADGRIPARALLFSPVTKPSQLQTGIVVAVLGRDCLTFATIQVTYPLEAIDAYQQAINPNETPDKLPID